MAYFAKLNKLYVNILDIIIFVSIKYYLTYGNSRNKIGIALLV